MVDTALAEVRFYIDRAEPDQFALCSGSADEDIIVSNENADQALLYVYGDVGSYRITACMREIDKPSDPSATQGFFSMEGL